MITKGASEELVVPGLGVSVPKVRDFGRKRSISSEKGKRVMNVLPNGTPRLGPDGRVTTVNLLNSIGG